MADKRINQLDQITDQAIDLTQFLALDDPLQTFKISLMQLANFLGGDVPGATPGAAIDLGVTDLNSITTPGFYYQDSSADAQAGANYPAGVAGALMVMKTSEAAVFQLYAAYPVNTDKRIYYRVRDSASSWSAWIAPYDSANRPTADEVGAVSLNGSSYINGTLGVGDSTTCVSRLSSDGVNARWAAASQNGGTVGWAVQGDIGGNAFYINTPYITYITLKNGTSEILNPVSPTSQGQQPGSLVRRDWHLKQLSEVEMRLQAMIEAQNDKLAELEAKFAALVAKS